MPGNQEWETPPDLWAAIVARYGEFQLDACASEHNTKCEAFITEEENSLDTEQVWIRRKFRHLGLDMRVNQVYINPGFAKPAEWAVKAYREAQKDKDALCLMMGLGSHSTDWFRWCYENCYRILDLSPRPQFIAPPGVMNSSNAHENCLFEFRHDDYTEGFNATRLSDQKRVPWRWKP